MRLEPTRDVDARHLLQHELAPQAVNREPGLHPDLARVEIEADPQSPDRALVVEPGAVQPHLAPVVGVDGLEIVDPQQHAEVHIQ